LNLILISVIPPLSSRLTNTGYSPSP
jgi:hypothetical protein